MSERLNSMLPLYEAKLLHQFDHRWATYDGSESRDVLLEEKADPSFVVQPRYWVPSSAVAERLADRWNRRWLLCWRDIARNTDIRTTIVSIVPRVGVGHKALLLLPSGGSGCIVCFMANLCSYILDFVSRQKVGGTNMAIFVLKQLPVLPPETYANASHWNKSHSVQSWMLSRVLELIYTAQDMKPFAEDLGYDGEPFRWDENRRFQLRCELDAAFFNLYLGSGEWSRPENESPVDRDRLLAAFPTPRDAVAHIMDTFPIVRQKDIAAHGAYRTKDTILAIYDQMATGRYVSPLNPSPDELFDREEADEPLLDLFGEPITQLPTGADLVIKAFESVRDGWSTEYVVCHPEMNERFEQELREIAPSIAPDAGNRILFNARKSGFLTESEPSKRYRPPADCNAYEFVCEWAFRHLQAQLKSELHGQIVTLDEILCTTDWRRRFDELAQRVKPGFSLLDYRWLAMRVRKRLRKQGGEPGMFEESMPAKEATQKLPDQPGVFSIIAADTSALYTGWSPNLREQANRLVDTGAGEIIPIWLLRNSAFAQSIAFRPFEKGVANGVLHDIWRGELHRHQTPLNLFDDIAA